MTGLFLSALILLSEQSIAPAAKDEAPAAAAASASALLWRDLREGMTPEQAASALRAVIGVKAVQVVRKKKKPAKLNVSYDDDGIIIGPMKVVIGTTFEGDSLQEVFLKADDCASAGIEQTKTTAAALREKYGNGAREKVVDDQGVLIEYRAAFWNDETRVRMSWTEYNPASVNASSGYGGTLGKIADLFGAISSDMAENACPTDGGARLTTLLTYSAQSAFTAAQQKMNAENEAKRKATKQGL